MSKQSILENKEAVAAAIKGSKSSKEVLRKLGLTGGTTFRYLRKWCEIHELELPIFDRPTHTFRKPDRYSDEEVFIENSTYNRSGLKKRLRKIWAEWKCASCGLGDEWNGKPLTLQLEHKNGISNDNRLENLELLCPNCHTQTATYARAKSYRGVPNQC